ncbi:hypothetical protein Salat_2963900 [Sesamum alatum]|uniref:Uncharacterized protein n=1 Tax=Sesamum alatum TaxID=300844 RepID=A0AAE1XI11_9LAMI|nr:hypothetical protein Salat_2963900 [Sesamum alatum]
MENNFLPYSGDALIFELAVSTGYSPGTGHSIFPYIPSSTKYPGPIGRVNKLKSYSNSGKGWPPVALEVEDVRLVAVLKGKILNEKLVLVLCAQKLEILLSPALSPLKPMP